MYTLLIRTKLTFVLSGLATSNEGGPYDLLVTVSQLAFNSKLITNVPCQLLRWWMNNSSWSSVTAGIQTCDLPHNMNKSKKIRCSFPLGHRSGFLSDQCSHIVLIYWYIDISCISLSYDGHSNHYIMCILSNMYNSSALPLRLYHVNGK